MQVLPSLSTARWSRLCSLIALSFTLAIYGCSSSSSKSDEPKLTTEADLYQQIERQLKNSQWETAIRNLQRMEEHFPFGTYAEQAQLELIYAYYQSNEADAAIATANRFIRLHPQHRNVDYAYYMLGMAAYAKDRSMFNRVLPVDITQRDPGSARDSLANFTQLLNRFPNSPYAADAKRRMLYLRNTLARYEVHAANYYFQRGAYIAAIGRGRFVLENFSQTPAIPDALAVIVQGYRLMNMTERANEYQAILATNYPDYPAIKKDGQWDDNYMWDNGRTKLLPWLTLGLFSKRELTGFDTRELYDNTYRDSPPKFAQAQRLQ